MPNTPAKENDSSSEGASDKLENLAPLPASNDGHVSQSSTNGLWLYPTRGFHSRQDVGTNTNTGWAQETQSLLLRECHVFEPFLATSNV
jgi:hypothetical protein